MAGRGAIRPKHRAARIGPIDAPVATEMFRKSPIVRSRMTPDDQIRDSFGHVYIGRIACCLERGHQRLGEMHIRVLAAIRIVNLPITSESLSNCPELLFPKLLSYDRRDVSDQPISVGMAGHLGARRGQEDKGVTIGLFCRVRRTIVADRPIIPSIVRVAVAIPQEVHSVIDNDVGARPTHEIGDRVSMNDSGGRKEIPRGLASGAIAGGCWASLVVEIVKAAKRINDSPLEKRE